MVVVIKPTLVCDPMDAVGGEIRSYIYPKMYIICKELGAGICQGGVYQLTSISNPNLTQNHFQRATRNHWLTHTIPIEPPSCYKNTMKRRV